MEDSNFMHRFGYDLDAFRSVWADRGVIKFCTSLSSISLVVFTRNQNIVT